MNDRNTIVTLWELRWLLAAMLLLLFLALDGPARALTISAQTEEGEAVAEELVPLTFHSFEVAIHNQVASTTSWYHFRNEHEIDVEVTCEVALADRELIEGFSYYNGKERIVGEVLEKSVAEAVYEELTQIQHRDPGLLEQEGNRFRFRVYPVQPGETKPVEVRQLALLERREGVVEYLIPKENLPQDPGLFSLVVDITDELPITSVEVAGFGAEVVRFGPHHQRLFFEGEEVAFQDDLRIRYRLRAEGHSLRLTAHRAAGEEGTFMLLLSPKEQVEEEEIVGRDLVFVIDISGSMSGEPLDQTRFALTHILGELNPADRFEIIAFDDATYPLLDGLRPVSQEWLEQSRKQVGELQSRGGTDILNAMKRALDTLEAHGRADRPQAIIFLTDGQGSHPASVVVGEVRRRGGRPRVFSFGVGDGVNRPFLERLARENRGIATMVSNPERLEAEMRRLYQRISAPLLVDLELSLGGLEVTSLLPERLPDLYRDSEVVIFGRYRRGGTGQVSLAGLSQGRRQELTVPVELPELEQLHCYVEKLWAQEMVGRLSDRLGEVPDAESEQLTREITRLGIVYNLVTEFTTFLAVPESLKTDEIKEMIRKGTMGYERKLIDSVEGIKLSMQHLPPGDPVLTVEAPIEARRVVAYFPFGLVQRLKLDEVRGVWNMRFLVPRDVADGLYRIRVQIVHADGAIEWRTVDYYIDGTAPEFDAEVPVTARAGESVELEVDPHETVAEVVAFVVGLPGAERVELTLDALTGKYRGRVTLPERFPEGPVVVRIVVRDEARNRFEQDFEIWEEDNWDEIPGC